MKNWTSHDFSLHRKIFLVSYMFSRSQNGALGMLCRRSWSSRNRIEAKSSTDELVGESRARETRFSLGKALCKETTDPEAQVKWKKQEPQKALVWNGQKTESQCDTPFFTRLPKHPLPPDVETRLRPESNKPLSTKESLCSPLDLGYGFTAEGWRNPCSHDLICSVMVLIAWRPKIHRPCKLR